MIFRNKTKNKTSRFTFDSEKLFLAASQSARHIYSYFESRKEGLYHAEAVERLKEVGKNEIASEKQNNWFTMLIKAFIVSIR